MENQIVIDVNTDCQSFTCFFRNGVSEQLFNDISTLNSMPGWNVKYGVDTIEGGLDKSILLIHHNKSEKTKEATEYLETSLRDIFLFREILWRRGINYQTLEGSHASDVF